jgi:hypothetical protein
MPQPVQMPLQLSSHQPMQQQLQQQQGLPPKQLLPVQLSKQQQQLRPGQLPQRLLLLHLLLSCQRCRLRMVSCQAATLS